MQWQPNGEMMMLDKEDEFDVVVDALIERKNKLQKMNEKNLPMFSDIGIMDQIRFEQISELEKAIIFFKGKKK